MILAAPRVTAQSVTVLHRFDANGVDGFGPNGSLIFDAAGNLYGTTAGGGASCGTVFELSPKAGGGWTEKILYNFGCDNQFGEDGPIGSLIFDANGNLYGATAAGGTGECYNPFNDQNELLGCGTVFELTPSDGAWTEKVLHNFTDSTRDGASPNGGLIFDAAGNLYGTTGQGGSGCLVKEGSTGWLGGAGVVPLRRGRGGRNLSQRRLGDGYSRQSLRHHLERGGFDTVRSRRLRNCFRTVARVGPELEGEGVV
jgi:uncharacterized repeat protein (TIGR03803 family)